MSKYGYDRTTTFQPVHGQVLKVSWEIRNRPWYLQTLSTRKFLQINVMISKSTVYNIHTNKVNLWFSQPPLIHLPIRIHHRQDEEVHLIQQLIVARICHQLLYHKCHSRRTYPFSCMNTWVHD